ncbi:MAG: ATP synthase subunit I [Gammaproteobacteria bacterium]|nr:ATP synthase subunit I [Gammaproteobacteria bacterium]
MELKPLDGILDIFYSQIIAAILVFGLVLIVDHHGGISFMAGAGTMLMANGYLTWRVYRHHRNMRSMNLLLSFFGGEFGKYALIAVCTLLFARWLELSWLFYVIGVGVPQLGGVIIYGMKKSWRA